MKPAEDENRKPGHTGKRKFRSDKTRVKRCFSSVGAEPERYVDPNNQLTTNFWPFDTEAHCGRWMTGNNF